MGKRNERFQYITSISAIIVAIAAIAVSIWQGVDNRKHNRLSVKPKLQIIFKSDLLEGPQITVSNNGLGPATVDKLEVSLNGKTFPGSAINAVLELKREMGLDGFSFSFDPIEGSTIRAGEKLVIMKFPDASAFKEVYDSLAAYINQIDFHLTYQSMYGENFTTDF